MNCNFPTTQKNVARILTIYFLPEVANALPTELFRTNLKDLIHPANMINNRIWPDI